VEAPATAPGNDQVKLRAVRIISDGNITGKPRIDKEIEIQVDYWNMEKDARRLISIHVYNSMGILIFTSANTNCASLVPDPWLTKKYPQGLFVTSCTIPISLLNNGVHNVDVFINGVGSHDNIISTRNILSFDAQESEGDRSEHLGEWTGAVRPRLLWQTRHIE